MGRSIFETQFLVNEAESLLTRLNGLKPFALNMPMVPAASISDEGLKGITDLLLSGYKELKAKIRSFINWAKDPLNHRVSAAEAQAKYSILKLRFNALLDQLDIFGDVMAQRSEHETGVWVAGLDALAADTIKIDGLYYDAPPLICFLERGHGAAIRRARTRLPGGDLNPVAVIQVPRERMVGSGIASSLVHEVGHQGAALLELVESLRENIRERQDASDHKLSWECYYRWISEIIADFWAMAHLGIGATLGLMSVVSLPKYFIFRINLEDPHPFPWIRVKLSLGFGKILYPHAQWARFEQLWERLYPRHDATEKIQELMEQLELTIPAFVNMVINHESPKLGGRKLVDVFPCRNRQPAHLQHLYNLWRFSPDDISKAPPSLLFAVIGQARADANITATKESELLSRWLTNWAFMNSEKRTKKERSGIYKELKQLVNN
jgi:hypothetical protein